MGLEWERGWDVGAVRPQLTSETWGESDSKRSPPLPVSGAGSFTGPWLDDTERVGGAENQGRGLQKALDGNGQGGNSFQRINKKELRAFERGKGLPAGPRPGEGG